jgi:phage shock protein PspC (stress-responsive transcriptional regulator)
MLDGMTQQNFSRLRLRRHLTDRVLGGVGGGIGACLGLGGWPPRVALLLIVLASPAFGLLFYVFLWVALPASTAVDVQPLARPGDPSRARYAKPEAVLTIGALSVAVGVVLLAQETGVLQAAGGQNYLAPAMLLLIGLVVLGKHLRGVA